MRVLLVEPYCGGSHRAWAEGYARHSSHEVSLLTLEGRWWKWRMRGAALTLGKEAAERAADEGPPDLVVATDMLDLPAFLGFTRGRLGGVPAVLYMHESQLGYPVAPRAEPDLSYAFTNWLSAAAADRVFFNSRFHLGQFFDELPRLLRHFPDHSHEPHLEEVRARCEVLPVGVDLRRLDGDREVDGGPPVVLWNQRWEHDKAPEEFFAALEVLAADGVPFRVVVCGENVRQFPEEFVAARQRLGERLLHMGYAPDPEYVRWLHRADVVVSCARQEFFGVAVVEAVYAGAFPVLPARLSYPELIPAELHRHCLYEEGGLVERLRWAITHAEEARRLATRLRPAMTGFDWSTLAPDYDSRWAGVAAGR